MNALRNIYAALSPGGIVVDTQPLSPRPRVATETKVLGTLDMGAWEQTVRAVDERTEQVISTGLLELEHEERFVVVDGFDSGTECLETAQDWRDTRVPPQLAARLERTVAPVTVEQEVRLRLFRRPQL